MGNRIINDAVFLMVRLEIGIGLMGFWIENAVKGDTGILVNLYHLVVKGAKEGK